MGSLKGRGTDTESVAGVGAFALGLRLAMIRLAGEKEEESVYAVAEPDVPRLLSVHPRPSGNGQPSWPVLAAEPDVEGFHHATS